MSDIVLFILVFLYPIVLVYTMARSSDLPEEDVDWHGAMHQSFDEHE